MAAADGDDSLYPIAVLIDELRNEDVQVRRPRGSLERRERGPGSTGGPRGKGSVFPGSGGRGWRPISVQLSSLRIPGLEETAPWIGCRPSGGRERGRTSRVPGLPSARGGSGPGRPRRDGKSAARVRESGAGAVSAIGSGL